MTAITFGQLRSRFLPGALAVSLLAGACVSDDPSSTGSTSGTDLDSGDLVLTSARLRTADSCDALLEHLVAEGVERVGPYGFGGGGYWGPGRFEEVSAELDDAAMADDGAGDFDSAPATTVQSGEEGGDFSGTNNQEVSVEEADRVKTDGDRLVILRGDTLEVFDVRGEVPELERSIRLGENAWGSEMFLVGDRVLLLSQSWIDRPFLADDIAIGRPDGTTTSRITEVDLLTGSVEATIEVEGIYLSAREVDGSIRIVTSSPLGNFNFLYPSNPGAEDAATEANQRLVEESTIDQWIPTYRQSIDGDTVAEGRAFDCEDMYLPNEFAGFAALTVLTVDIDDGLRIKDSLGVLSDGQTVYASTDRLTVASNRYPEWDWETGEIIGGDDDHTTSLHNFDITDPGRTEYVASGSVPGSLLSQYSLSEYDGLLRVATTEGSVWGRAADSQSMVTVLEEQGSDLVAIGMVDGLGEGEQIFAVRFMGDVAYVVTFRQIDPLYTVDLSEPTDPRVLGELKIPGFSTYLHSVGDGLLLGIGQDASDEGFTTGAQASLFDVSDLSDPVRVDQLGFGRNSYSAVDWDPKAFLFWGRRDLAVIPVSAWSYNEATGEEGNSSTAVLVEVNENGTLTELGRIGHPVTSECENYGVEPLESDIDRPATDDVVSSDAEAEFVEGDPPESGSIEVAPEYEEWCWSYQPEITRSIIIGDSIYTVSDAGVKVNDLDGLDTITWVPFARR